MKIRGLILGLLSLFVSFDVLANALEIDQEVSLDEIESKQINCRRVPQDSKLQAPQLFAWLDASERGKVLILESRDSEFGGDEEDDWILANMQAGAWLESNCFIILTESAFLCISKAELMRDFGYKTPMSIKQIEAIFLKGGFDGKLRTVDDPSGLEAKILALADLSGASRSSQLRVKLLEWLRSWTKWISNKAFAKRQAMISCSLGGGIALPLLVMGIWKNPVSLRFGNLGLGLLASGSLLVLHRQYHLALAEEAKRWELAKAVLKQVWGTASGASPEDSMTGSLNSIPRFETKQANRPTTGGVNSTFLDSDADWETVNNEVDA